MRRQAQATVDFFRIGRARAVLGELMRMVQNEDWHREYLVDLSLTDEQILDDLQLAIGALDIALPRELGENMRDNYVPATDLKGVLSNG